MKIFCETRTLHPRHEFRISRGQRAELRNVFVTIDADGVTGIGEASPNAFYAENWQSVSERIAEAARHIETLKIRSVADIGSAWSALWPLVAPSRAAQCAIDLAIWDWLAKREGVSVCELAWGARPRPVATFCTIGLSTPEELSAKIEEVRDFPSIKIKMDASADLAPVRSVRNATQALIAVDANCAWSSVDLEGVSRDLAALSVRFIEQPFPPAEIARLSRDARALPIFADENCVTEADVPLVAQHFAGFNIKLVKCGGLTPALRMIRQGRDLGCQLMIGCMLESSVLIAAGAVAAQGTDFADLDGAWLLADDPFSGWRFERGLLHPPPTSGLGVELMSR